MINIVHPKVTAKPPLNKLSGIKRSPRNSRNTARDSPKEKKENLSRNDGKKCNDCTQDDLKSQSSDSGSQKECKNINSTQDCNQNVIEPDSCSFEQLCSMIDDLEKNLNQDHQVLTVNTSFIPVEESPVSSHVKYLEQTLPEKDESREGSICSRSTYDDIMHFLGTLEQDYVIPDFDNHDNDNNRKIQELFDQNQIRQTKISRTRSDVRIISETMKEELATALLKLEDREATIKVLKEELKNERKVICEKLEKNQKNNVDALQAQKIKYQNVIKRHQKFIEQLITEKKDLTEKCDSLAQKIKEMEVKFQRDLKVAVERQAIELQRTREMCMASEKIRRERWLESKTSKIKEMTVKGLEPELRSMVEQHQLEIQEIRSAHMKELQDVELRTIRRSNQQLEQLRLELTESHDKLMANEKEALRLRYKEKFDEQETLMQSQQRKFFEDLQNEKQKFSDELMKKNQDNETLIKKISEEFQEKIDKLMRQNEIEKKSMKETLCAEREAWMENFKRQQVIKFEMSEARIRDECDRERDRQIELAIERLEKEARDMKNNVQRSCDNKLRCMKEKYESDLQIVKENEKLVKDKLLVTQQKLEITQIDLQKIESKLGKCLADYNESNRALEKLTRERDHAKNLARQEIECEKRELEDKIASLYKEIGEINLSKDTHMAQLYSRIKLIVTQKDLMINKVTKEADDARNRCDHLEKMLDQQRKDYVLKSI